LYNVCKLLQGGNLRNNFRPRANDTNTALKHNREGRLAGTVLGPKCFPE